VPTTLLEPPVAAPSTPATPARRAVAVGLGTVVFSHGVVDLFSAIIIPLLTVLEGRLSLSPAEGALVIGLGSICSGLIQPVVALLSDRHDTRWFGTLGVVVAVVAIGLTGYATAYWHLLLIQALGAAGVGAFHPVAAAAVGHLSGVRRSLGVAVFFAAGMSGGILGSIFAPQYAKTLGLPALAWLIIPGLLVALLLQWAVHGTDHRARGASAAHSVLSPAERRARWTAVMLLYAGNACRYTVNMMMVQLFIRWAETLTLARAGATVLDQGLRVQSSTLGGPLQAAMQLGMGGAGLLIGAAIRPARERAALVLIPIVASAAIAAIAYTSVPAVAFALAVAAGAGFFGVMPITVSMAQRLLPHRTSLASGLMMGGAWAVAAVGPPLVEVLLPRVGLGGTFWAAAGLLAVSGLLGLFVKPVDR